jgi:Antitoxin MazE-like
MSATGRKSSQEKVSAYRRRLRAQGLRPIQIWVPDVRSPGFKAQAHRQSLAVATSPRLMRAARNAVTGPSSIQCGTGKANA